MRTPPVGGFNNPMIDNITRSPCLIDTVTLRRVHARLAADGTDLLLPLAFLEFTDDGVRISIIDPSGTVIGHDVDTALSRDGLDRLIADHLVATGRVQEPTDPAWYSELIHLSGVGRVQLEASAGTFLMGDDYVHLFRMTRTDVEDATVSAAVRVQEHAADVCASTGSAGPGALVLDDSRELWPGVADLLWRVTGLPVVVLGDIGDDYRPDAHDTVAAETTTQLDSGDFPAAAAHYVDVEDLVSTDRIEPEGDRDTGLDGETRPAWWRRRPLASSTPTAGLRSADEVALDDVAWDQMIFDDPPFTPRTARRRRASHRLTSGAQQQRSASPVESDPDGDVASASVRPPQHLAHMPRRRISARTAVPAAAAAGAVAFVCAATAFAIGHDSDAQPANKSAMPEASGASQSPRQTAPSIDPGLMARVRQPAALYTPKSPTTRESPSESAATPNNPPPPRHRRPPPLRGIPGLPPVPRLPALPPLRLP